MYLYLGSKDNQLGVVEVDDDTGNLIRIVEIIDPVIEASQLPPVKAGLFSMRTSSTYSPTTEWVVKHPTLDLLYAFTSFMSEQQAMITTYQIDRSTGHLTKLGTCFSGGFQAAFAMFSPDGSVLVVAHHNDGKLAFFDCTAAANGGVLESPIQILESPEIRPGTRNTEYPYSLPSLHHCMYTPDGRFLLTVDCSPQSRIWTYLVNERGIPVSDTPMSNLKVAAIRAFPSAVANLGSQYLASPNRIRRIAFHPSGRYIYILLELHSLIQVYEMRRDGSIVADCLQEVPTVDPSYFDTSKLFRFVGLAVNAAAEMVATAQGIWVSNRGHKVAGNAESSVRFFEYQEGGARIANQQVLVSTGGPVRHFALMPGGTKIVSGAVQKIPGLVETFQSTSKEAGDTESLGLFNKTGEATVGMEVFCIVPVTRGS
eukprot:Nitzschia sp. Nitz4//scaffold163_size50693//18311//19591//NITZ4_006987-RA/size50693-processed-gene-0.45-mRNA-1//-1//CDS//3329538028//497//frame0